MASGSVSTTATNTALLAGIAVNNAADLYAITNLFTELAETSTGTPDIVCGDRFVTSAGTYSTTVSQRPAPVTWQSAGIIIALRDSEQPSGFNVNQSSMFLAM
jgi:hypothetical protein